MRYTDKFLNAVRENVANPKPDETGQQLFSRTIEEVSNVPFKKYEKNAIQAQKEMIEKYR
jgi:hypothetical protein